MRISRCGLPPGTGAPVLPLCYCALLRQPGELIERRHAKPVRASARPRCRRAAEAGPGPAAGQIRDRVGAKLAALSTAVDGDRTVSGGVLGRIVAGAAVYRPRHRPFPVRRPGAGRAVSAHQVSLAEPRRGLEPARPRLGHSPSPGDRADRYAQDPGSGGAGAVAGAARTHAGIGQAPPRRAAPAAGDQRSWRTEAASDWNGVLSPANIRVDAWVTPPLYTGKPPVILSAANKEATIPATRPV